MENHNPEPTEIHFEELEDVNLEIGMAIKEMMRDSYRVESLRVLIRLLDAGIDVLAMEGAIKHPGIIGTLEGQMEIRETMIGGVKEAFSFLGVSDEEFDVALAELALSKDGFNGKQSTSEIKDRLKVWDKKTVVAMLYGPKKAEAILRKMDENAED